MASRSSFSTSVSTPAAFDSDKHNAGLRIVVEKVDIKSVTGSIRVVDAQMAELQERKLRSAAELLAALAVQRMSYKSKLSQTPGKQSIGLNYSEMKEELDSVGCYDLDHFERTVKDMFSSVGSTASFSYDYASNGVKNQLFYIQTSVD